MARYEPNYRSMGNYLRRSGPLKRVLREAAGDIADMAAVIAPIDTGAYVESIEVVDADMLDRQGMIVQATDPAAAPIEFGNRRTGGRGHDTLSRAAEICGFEVAD